MSIEDVSDPIAERAAARAKRRAFMATPVGAFARAMWDAMGQYWRMRGQGVTREDACKGLEAVWRDTWPKPITQFPPACSECEDTGWSEHTCWHEQRCGRIVCGIRHPAWEHTFVTPCGCVAGDRHRRRLQTIEDEIAAVGRVQQRKATGFKRLGA